VILLCSASDVVRVLGAAPDVAIRIYANNQLVGYGGGSEINLVRPLKAGEIVTATQSVGACTSQRSRPVTVDAGVENMGQHFVVGGGHTFFKAGLGEKAVDSPVFLRGSSCPPRFVVRKAEAGSAYVNIVDSKGRMAKRLRLRSLPSGEWVGKWDWTSSLWQKLPDEIPVGRYSAVLYFGSTRIEALPFYVIFDPAEVTAPVEFSLSNKGKTGIWFASGWGSDRALTYALHPNDMRVFSTAIKTINGQTDSYTSTNLLRAWVANHFHYDLSYHTNDVIILLEQHTSAQCADEANMLTGLLRSMGIPAHPATADAAVEYGGYSWNFDTWTEARIKSPSKAEDWYVAHPHEYPTMDAQPRSIFGANQGVATKQADDLIIMAGASWVNTEVSDNNADVRFGYNTPCHEPDRNFSYVASWLENLSFPYWGRQHWECSPPKSDPIRIMLDREVYHVGDEVRVEVSVENMAEATLAGTVEITIVENDLTAKKFPSRTLHSTREEVRLPAGASQLFKTAFKLPGDVFADHEYLVVVRMPDQKKLYATRPFKVLPLFSTYVEAPRQVPPGSRFAAVLTITNGAQVPLRNVTASLLLPIGIAGVVKPLRIEQIAPGESVTARWALQSGSPNYVLQFVFEVTSENGGSARIYRGIEIVEAAKPRASRQ